MRTPRRPTFRLNIRNQCYQIQSAPLKGAVGRCDPTNQVITIAPEACCDGLLNTLTHEVLHAACPRLEEWEVAYGADAVTRAIEHVVKNWELSVPVCRSRQKGAPRKRLHGHKK